MSMVGCTSGDSVCRALVTGGGRHIADVSTATARSRHAIRHLPSEFPSSRRRSAKLGQALHERFRRQRCAEAIQASVFGTVSTDHGKKGFESFSIDLHTVSNLTFMTEGECGRRRMELIKEANQSIHLATYNFDDDILADLLVERAQAGIRVRCILSEKKWLKRNQKMADKLRSAGVDVHLVRSHAKCLVVDDDRVLLGSANASAAKWQGLEFNLEMHSPDFAKRIVRFLDDLPARDRQGDCAPTDIALPPASP